MEDKKKDSGGKLERFFSGKGYYIVLFLCAAVIGVSAWTLLSPGERAVESHTVVTVTAKPSPMPTPVPTQQAEETVWDVPEDAQEVIAEPVAPEVQAQEPVTQEQPEPASEPQQADPAPVNWIWPVYGQIEQPYAMTELVYDKTMADWRTHDGIDIESSLGTQVLAAADGVVSEVYTDELLGTTVVIEHGGGVVTVYSNLAELPTVSAGQSVSMGDTIGAVGTTALAEAGEVYHLHFALRVNGTSADPAEYLPQF